MKIKIFSGATFKRNSKFNYAEHFPANTIIYEVDKTAVDVLDKMGVKYEILKEDTIKTKTVETTKKKEDKGNIDEKNI